MPSAPCPPDGVAGQQRQLRHPRSCRRARRSTACWAETTGASSERISRPTVSRSRWPWSMRLNLARLVFSQSCSVFFCVVSLQVADHLVDGVLQRRHLALGLDRDRPRQVALGDGGGHLGDGAHLRGQVGGELVDVVGQALPGAGGAGHLGLAAELAFDAHLAGHRRHLVGEGGQRVDHAVDGVGQGGDLALGFDGQLLLQVAVGHGGHHLGDAAHLAGQVAGHEVDVVGEVLPGAGDALHLGLAAELAFGADLAGHAGHFRRRTS